MSLGVRKSGGKLNSLCVLLCVIKAAGGDMEGACLCCLHILLFSLRWSWLLHIWKQEGFFELGSKWFVSADSVVLSPNLLRPQT